MLNLLDRLPHGQLNLEQPDGHLLHLPRMPSGAADAHCVLHNWQALERTLKSGDIGLAEAYLDGEWDSPDVTALLALLARNRDALRDAVPGAARVLRPQRLAGGLAGLWRLEPVVIAGLSGAQTFFFSGRELRRVEFVADASDLADGGAAAFGALLAFGRSTYGPETAANDPSGSYAAWTQGGLEVYAQRVPAPRATVRWVIKQSEGKDASEL